MGSADSLIRATLNRIGARVGHGLADAAAELAVLAQDAPSRLRQEWDLFQDEVRAEAERLESPEGDEISRQKEAGSVDASDREPQELIDRLRATVADLSKRIEVRS